LEVLASVDSEALLSIEKSTMLVNNCQPKLPELSCMSHHPTFLHLQHDSSCEGSHDGGILLLQDGGVSIPHSSQANQYLPQAQPSLQVNC
jgi:hypothetical protein